MVRCKIQLAVIMTATYNADPTQGDLIKLIRILAYLKGTPDLGPTFYTICTPNMMQPSVFFPRPTGANSPFLCDIVRTIDIL